VAISGASVMNVSATRQTVSSLMMARAAAKKVCSIQPAKIAVTFALVLAGLTFLTGCQGVSAGGNDQQQTTTLSLNTATLQFGSVQPGRSKTLTFTAANSGPASVTVSSISISSKSFTLLSPAVPMTVAAGQSVPVSVNFTPNAAGSFTATATVTSNASDTSMTLSLSGTGTSGSQTGDLGSNPSSEAFGSVTIGSQPSQIFTLTNNGSANVDISAVSITGTGFQLSGITPPLTLASSQSTTFKVVFAPQSTQAVSGSVTITSDASNSPLTVGLSGSGTTVVGQLAVAPSTLALGSVAAGASGSAQGALSATGASINVTSAGTNNAAFSLTGLTLPATIPAGQSVPFTVTFTPTATGAATATLSFTSNASNSPTSETLTGTGTAAPSYDVALSWNSSTSSDISGYNVYRAVYANSNCGSFAKINPSLNAGTAYTDSKVVDGTSYCYEATAVNASNQESGPSNIVSNVQIPAP
jgi:Protein of unknown function (DUF1573)/Abnormal spindle-like microcephaly-assoc'd, ASPM-SPD-2-Hydin